MDFTKEEIKVENILRAIEIVEKLYSAKDVDLTNASILAEKRKKALFEYKYTSSK